MQLRREALRDVHAPAGRAVEKMMTETFVPGDFNLPKPKTLIRQMNKARQNVRPLEPTSVNFEVNEHLNFLLRLILDNTIIAIRAELR